MSRGLHRGDNGEQDVELCDTIQRADMERLDDNTGHMREECNQRNQHEQPVESSQPNIASDAGNSGTDSGDIGNRNVKHTSFPCKHCGDHIGNAGLGRKHKYTVHPTNADYIERDYAEYLAATGSKGQDTSTGIWNSIESRNFKQTNADSAGSIERCTGIPAGVTV